MKKIVVARAGGTKHMVAGAKKGTSAGTGGREGGREGWGDARGKLTTAKRQRPREFGSNDPN